MAGKIVADTLEHSTAGSIATNYVVEGSAKAWVRFDQTGTLTVNDSFNQSSMADNGFADATLTLSSAMNNADYSFSGCSGSGSTGISFVSPKSSDPTTTTLRMVGTTHTGTNSDRVHNGWSILGDLA